MAKTNNNPVLHNLRGAIGKELVIKQYSYGTVVTGYPDMSNVKPSKLQRNGRNRFKQAVAFAQNIIGDTALNKAWKAKCKKGRSVYHTAIKEYMKKHA